jgi:dephospho-CoA kinase
MPKVIGVTGGIATGKSTVTRLFQELGALTLSADDIARDVLARDGAAYKETVERFGRGILQPDGEIDRAALGAVVFADSQARADLNELTHPHIISTIQAFIDRFRMAPPAPDSVMVVEIPLLMECGLQSIVDEVVVVAAEPQTQECRLTTRSNLTAEEARRRIEAQMPIELKVERADRVIWNTGSLDDLRDSVRAVWDEMHLL